MTKLLMAVIWVSVLERSSLNRALFLSHSWILQTNRDTNIITTSISQGNRSNVVLENTVGLYDLNSTSFFASL